MLPKAPYRSPIRAIQVSPEKVVYHCSVTGDYLGKVYKSSGKWFLNLRYWPKWQPIEVLTKYKGFLLLYDIHNKRSGYPA